MGMMLDLGDSVMKNQKMENANIGLVFLHLHAAMINPTIILSSYIR